MTMLVSPRLITDQTDSVIARHDFIPFGEEIPNTVAGRYGNFGSSSNVTQGFTGQESDGGSAGLDFYNARHFSAVMGSFMQPDPGNAGADFLRPQSWNGYGYVLGNPLGLVDPSGMIGKDPDGIDDGDCFDAGNSSPCGYYPLGGWGGGVGGGGPRGGGPGPAPTEVSSPSPLSAEICGPEGCDAGESFADNSGFDGYYSCSNNPAVSAGINLAENLAITKFLVKGFKNPLTTYQASKAYTGLVSKNGFWDYKNRPGVPDSQRQANADAGNVNFGYTCGQFPTGKTQLGNAICMYGAGYAQHKDSDVRIPYSSRSHGDLARDNYFVRLGLWLAKIGC